MMEEDSPVRRSSQERIHTEADNDEPLGNRTELSPPLPELSADTDTSTSEASCEDSDSQSEEPYIPEKRRKYTYHSRNRNPRGTSEMRRRWGVVVDSQTSTKIRLTPCCFAHKCFETVDIEFLLAKQNAVLSMSKGCRREYLSTLIGSDHLYYFNGNQVCVAFLQKSFRYSRDIITDVRRCSKMDRSENERISFKARSERFSAQRDAVVTFLERTVNECGDKMPDCSEQHLPFFRKTDVYNAFIDEYGKLHSGNPPSKTYFYRTWKAKCPSVKVRKVSRFSQCSTCEQIRSALESGIRRGNDISIFKEMRETHLDEIRRERLEYKRKREISILHPDKYLSIIVDGADQTSFGLPHFVSKTKDMR